MINNNSIKLCLYLSQLAYDELTIRVNECECYVTTINGVQYVSFRGTEAGGMKDILKKGGWMDIIRDIRVWPTRSKRIGGYAHSGFMKGARGCVDGGLVGLLRKDEPVIFTGHSLGGSMALCAALMMHSMEFNVRGVVTFGAAKALTRKAISNRRGDFPVLQFENSGDPVPKFLLVLYSHWNSVNTGIDSGHGINDDYEEGLKSWLSA